MIEVHLKKETIGPNTSTENQAVLNWLLDSDPAIRWQVMRDLLGESESAVAAERAKVATEGWGARLLALQAPDGNWGGGTYVPDAWVATSDVLLQLRDLGLDPQSEPARRAIARVKEKCDWGPEWDFSPFFEGEVEACINGRVLAIGAYFGEASERLLERLLSEQMADGGWNCYTPPSHRGSFHSTICVLEGILEYEQAKGATATTTEARRRGEEYLLERKLFRKLSTGEVVNLNWTLLSFPNRWHYDILWGLDYMRRAGVAPDERMAEALELVAKKRDASGRWPLENVHPGPVHFEMEEPGQPSRWLTLRALRVLEWYGASV